MPRFANCRPPVLVLLMTCLMVPVIRPLSAQDQWFTQFDQLFLAPKISDAGVERIFYFDDLPSSTDEFGSLSNNLEYAFRLALGYEGPACGGFQIRWLTLDQSLAYTGTVNEGTLVSLTGDAQLDLDALDTELSQCGIRGDWKWKATAGARYGRLSLRENSINFEDLTDTVWLGSTGAEFEGAGPTLSLSGQRGVGATGIAVFGSGRTALLFGDTDVLSAFRGGGTYTNPDDFVQTWEFRCGLQAAYRLRLYDISGGIFWEGQRWDSDSDLLGDLALHGVGISSAIRY